jgi:hypothetical protein
VEGDEPRRNEGGRTSDNDGDARAARRVERTPCSTSSPHSPATTAAREACRSSASASSSVAAAWADWRAARSSAQSRRATHIDSSPHPPTSRRWCHSTPIHHQQSLSFRYCDLTNEKQSYLYANDAERDETLRKGKRIGATQADGGLQIECRRRRRRRRRRVSGRARRGDAPQRPEWQAATPQSMRVAARRRLCIASRRRSSDAAALRAASHLRAPVAIPPTPARQRIRQHERQVRTDAPERKMYRYRQRTTRRRSARAQRRRSADRAGSRSTPTRRHSTTALARSMSTTGW